MKTTTALLSSMLMLSACGLQTEDELISDAQLDAMQTSQAALTAAQTQTVPGAQVFHLRLAWGYLSGYLRALNWVDWSGGLKIDSGTVQLERLIFFERRDFAQPQTSVDDVKWTSRTRPHFDGVVLKVTSDVQTNQVHLTTPLFSKDFAASQLAQGVELRFDADAEGHQVSVSSLPDAACNGFAFGYMREAYAGWLGFAGLLTNASGEAQGRLRFRADQGAVRARLVSREGVVQASGEGQLDEIAGTFSFDLIAADGTQLGTVRGLYQGPAKSPWGSFQASLSCR